MQAIAVTTDGQSLFDQIKEVNEHGDEYWRARALQAALNYDRWQHFEEAILRLTVAGKTSNFAENAVFDRFDEDVHMPRGGTKTRVNYWLNRYAAYRLVMELESTNPQVDAAKHYFTLRVRQAEVAEQSRLASEVSAPLSLAEAYRRLADLCDRADALAAETAQQAAHIEAITPHAQLGAQVEAHEEHMSLRDFAARHSCNQIWFFARIDSAGAFAGRVKPLMYNAGSSRNPRRAPYQTYRERGYFENVAPEGYVDSWHLTAKGRTWLLDILTKEGLSALAARPIDRQNRELLNYFKAPHAASPMTPVTYEDQL